MCDRDFLVWLAGFFDGEGSVGLYLAKGLLSCKATIVNTDEAVLSAIHAAFGGSLRPRKRIGARQIVYALQLNGAEAEAMLRAIRPFLLSKAAQVDVFLHAREHLLGNGRILPEDLVAQRVDAVAAISALKRVECAG